MSERRAISWMAFNHLTCTTKSNHSKGFKNHHHHRHQFLKWVCNFLASFFSSSEIFALKRFQPLMKQTNKQKSKIPDKSRFFLSFFFFFFFCIFRYIKEWKEILVLYFFTLLAWLFDRFVFANIRKWSFHVPRNEFFSFLVSVGSVCRC